MISSIHELNALWLQLPYELRFKLWLAAGVCGLATSLVLFHWWLRRVLGHRKFRGRWYNASQVRALIEHLLAEQRETNRVLDHDELKLIQASFLRRGFPLLYRGRYGGYL